MLALAEDEDGARRLASDLAFVLPKSHDDDVLVLAMPETSPFADVNPDRRAAMTRMATLAYLSSGRPFRVLVAPAIALSRKLVPADAVRAHTHHVQKDKELDRELLIRQLTESGYLRVPVVEDPGSFAVRGSLFDVWPPGAESPSRIELYGDEVLSIKPFDPIAQTTRGESQEVFLPPARDTILAKDFVDRAKERIGQLADMIDWPTTKTRALIDDVAQGRAFFGADAYLPAYY